MSSSLAAADTGNEPSDIEMLRLQLQLEELAGAVGEAIAARRAQAS